MQPRVNNKRWLVLAAFLFLLIGVPLLLWLVAFFTHITLLIIPLLFWICLPGSLFGRPLFKTTMFGYDPVGWAGWSVTVLFYVVIALVLWAVVLVFLSRRGRPRI